MHLKKLHFKALLMSRTIKDAVLVERKRPGMKGLPGARFSKVPKLYGTFSGVTIPFVFQERRGFNSSNFTDLFLLVSLKTC